MFKKIISWEVIFFTIVIELITNFGNNISVLLLLLFTFFLITVDYKKNFKYLLLLFLISDDQSRFLTDNFKAPIYTIYTLPNLSMLITILLFLYSIKLIFTHKKLFLFKELKRTVQFIKIILIGGVIIGVYNVFLYTRIAMQDMSYFINSFAFLIITYYVYIKNKIEFSILLKGILSAITVKYLILMWLFVTGNGELVGSMVKVTGESGKSLLPLYACIYFLLFVYIKGTKKYFFLSMFFVSVTLTLSVASRSTMMFIVISLLMILILMKVTSIRRTTYTAVIIFGALIGVFVIEYLQPGAMGNVLWKLNSFGDIDVNEARSYSSLSAVIRYIEFLNIFYMHIEHNTLLFGSGFASYFVDDYVRFPFSLYDIHAYKSEWIDARTFFKPHTTPIFLFLKIGTIGVLYYYYTFFRVFLSLKKKALLINISLEYIFLLSILPNIFLIITKNYSSKMQIALGIYLAIAFLIVNQRKIKNEIT